MSETKPIGTVGKATAVLLVLNAIWSVIAIGSSALQLELIERMNQGDFTMAEANANDLREAAIGFMGMGLFILTGIVFLVWFRRTYDNLEAFGHTRERTSGWAIGVWFVPFASLIWPFQMTKEIFQKSSQESGEAVPALFTAWWCFWVVDNILGQLLMRIAAADDGLSSVELATTLSIGHEGIGIVSALLAMRVVQTLTKRQERGIASLGGESIPATF